MNIFGKKKSNDLAQDSEEDERAELNREVPTRKFKDLSPHNRKKRKEPIKPWGKGERLTVLIVLLVTVVASGVLGLTAREWKLPGLPQLNLSSINLNPFKEETIVIGGDGIVKTNNSLVTVNLFKEATKNLSGVYAFNVVRLEDGATYGVNQTEVMEAASLIKLPVFIALYQAADAGEINLETKYTLKESDKIGGSGSLSGRPAGTVLTYRQLAELMGQQSDNTAFGIFRKVLSDAKIQEIAEEIGMYNTSLKNNETSPEDIGIFFEKLYNGKLVSEKSKNEILGYLTNTIYETHLPGGVPPGIRVAHKYGREIHVVNDGGIVFAPKPFVLVIMTKGAVEIEADNNFAGLVKLIYDEESLN